jgi:hypothetical protein
VEPDRPTAQEPDSPTPQEEERDEPGRGAGSKAPWRRFAARSVPWLVTVVILGAALVQLLSVDASAPKRFAAPSPPARGVACPGLQQAEQQLEAGNDAGFVTTVRTAARAGEAALQRSGEIFGRPERLALDLASMLEGGTPPHDPDVDRLMTEIRAACRELDRWR